MIDYRLQFTNVSSKFDLLRSEEVSENRFHFRSNIERSKVAIERMNSSMFASYTPNSHRQNCLGRTTPLGLFHGRDFGPSSDRSYPKSGKSFALDVAKLQRGQKSWSMRMARQHFEWNRDQPFLRPIWSNSSYWNGQNTR